MFFRKKSPENTNNNTEQAPSANNAETDYPAFDPEAAKRRIAEDKAARIAEAVRQEAEFYQKTANYKSDHSDAVVDVDKAHFMALAEDPRRTAAIEARKEVPNMQKQAEEDYLEMMRKNAQNREGYPYPTPDEKDIERIKNARQNIANKVDEARHQDMLAAQDGKNAGGYYDSIHPEFEPDEKWRFWSPQQPSK